MVLSTYLLFNQTFRVNSNPKCFHLKKIPIGIYYSIKKICFRFLFYICFGKIDAKKCFITQNTKPFILHYFLTLVSPLPPTPILFLFFPFNYHFSSNKKLPPTHNNPTPSSMTSLSQPLNPTVERKLGYPKLNTITWTNPTKKHHCWETKRIKQPVVVAKMIHFLFVVVDVRERERERERERSKMMVAWLQDCNDK